MTNRRVGDPERFWQSTDRLAGLVGIAGFLVVMGELVGKVPDSLVLATLPPAVVVLGFLLARAAGWGRRWRRRRNSPDFPGGGDVFRGLGDPGDLEADERFPRESKEQELVARIESPETRFVSIAGESGSGKSVLLQAVRERLAASGHPVEVLDFGRSVDEARSTLESALEWLQGVEKVGDWEWAAGGKKAVVVLDQFETCIDEISRICRTEGVRLSRARAELGGRDQLVGQLYRLLDEAPGRHVCLVVVVRSDRYYDLRLLEGRADPPDRAVEVPGLESDSELGSSGRHSGIAAFVERLKKLQIARTAKVVGDLQEEDGTLLPVKAQLAGCLLESRARPREGGDLRARIDEKLLRNASAQELIRYYFEDVVRGAPSPDVTKEVLFLLSKEGRVAKSLAIETLMSMTYRTKPEIEQAIEHLLQKDEGRRGIVREAHGGYRLRHDYLAHAFRELSGRLLEPVRRDNLTAAYEEQERRGADLEWPADERVGRAKRFARLAKTFLLVFFSYRLLGYELFPAWVHPVGNPSGPMDLYYLPLVLAQGSWAVYAIDLVANSFVYLDDRRGERLVTLGVLAAVLFGGVLTGFFPALWLFFIGVSGLLVGVRYLIAGWKVKEGTGNLKNRFLWVGGYCSAMTVAWALFGIVFYARWDTFAIRPEGWRDLAGVLFSWNAIESFTPYSAYLAVVLLTFSAVFLYLNHATVDRGVEFIGQYRRFPQREG